MRRYIGIIPYLFCSLWLCAQTPTPTANYVLTETMLDSMSTNVIRSVQYFDGLGRPSQLVEGGINPAGKYLYSVQTYDGKGREEKRSLPIVGGNTSCGFLSPAELADLRSGTYSDTHINSQTTYDELDRPLFISTPGDNWNGRGRTIRHVTNGNGEVRKYEAGIITASSQGFYPEGTLTGEVAIDEDSVCVTTFRDLTGRTVLERRGEDDDTYFVYADNGLLRFILSPGYQESESATFRYRYDYDSRGRMIRKYLPSCNVISYWYDTDNRLVLMKDPRLQLKSRNRFYLYDRLGRLAVQGTCGSKNANSSCPVYATRQAGAGLYEVCGTGYYVTCQFTLPSPQIEIVNYYDDYEFLACNMILDSIPSAGLTAAPGERATALKTGDITGTSDGHLLARVYHYDAEGRMTGMCGNLLDGSILNTSTEYSFTGKPTEVQTTLDAGSYTFVIDESFSYDADTDQLLSHDIEYRDSTVCVGQYDYDLLGRIENVLKSDGRIGQTYSYNLHGWTNGTTAAKLYNGNSDLFSQNLYYESGSDTPCYNGNISAMRWKTIQQPDGNGYRFSYDKRNRLTEAAYCNYSDLSALPCVYSETMTYNRNSAVTSLTRTGNSMAGLGNMDQLTFTYVGNRLKKISDAATSNVYDGAFEFVDGTNATLEYWYNNAGDLTRDRNKGIALIQYDLLGHPTRVQFRNGNVTQYVYTADGRKLRTKQTTAVEGITVAYGFAHELTQAETMDVDSTDYAGNIQITRGSIGSNPNVPSVDYHFGDGYLSVTATRYRPRPGAVIGVMYVPSFHYYLRDHLGSNRVVADGNGTVEQTNEYYPYGGPWGDASTNQGFQPYKYTGKELDRVHGLDWYDYGARMYDPAFCQFTQMDPLCEQYPHLSPYVYCAGNPVRYVDPDGMKPRRKEALAMADDVYDPSNKELLGGWTWIDPKDLGLTLPNTNGFKSAIYGRKNIDGGYSEYVYATAGTELTSLEDWRQNYVQLTGRSEQYRQSVETAERIKSILGDQKLTYIGHSLGGGLASANALKTGDPAITFNAAGLSAQTKQALQLNHKADITAYVVRNEFVNNSQALIGLRAEGRISYLPSAPLSLFPRVTRPALSIAYHTMAYLKLISTLLKDE